jgi:small subunit ribosomal protein S7
MPRKGPAPKREIPPDPVYNDVMVSRFINRLFTRGKKSVGEKIFYQTLELVGQRTGKDPLEVFHQALRNAMPVLEVRPRRVGAPPTRFPWRSGPSAEGRWRSGGSSTSREDGAVRP